MKTKTKILAMAEIAIVLCSAFLVAIPAIAADQNQETQKASASTITTASEDDYVLGIYGNGNEDDTIDMGDVVYTKLAIFGKKPKTELCDAKYDGRINVLDVIQTKLIILGNEKELTIAQYLGYSTDISKEPVTVPMPVEKIIALTPYAAEAIRGLGAKDRIVGVDEAITEETTFFPDLSEKPSVGTRGSPDIELILELHPDTIITYAGTSTEKLEDKLVGTDIAVVRLHFTRIELLRREMDILGYLLGERENALEYLRWYDRYMDDVGNRVSGLAEDEKPDIFLFASDMTTKTTINAAGAGDGMHELCERAGGKNILAGEPGGMVEAEWVLQQDEERGIEVMLGRKYAWMGYEIDDPSAGSYKTYASIEEDYNKIVGLPGFSEITAVKNNRVHLIVRDITATPAIPVGLVYIAKWFHPTLFWDLDPKAIHQEYLDKFHKDLNYNVYEHGVFVYPEPS